jgi:hypothetical protein
VFLVVAVMFIVRKEIITINLYSAFAKDTFSRLGVSIHLQEMGAKIDTHPSGSDCAMDQNSNWCVRIKAFL